MISTLQFVWSRIQLTYAAINKNWIVSLTNKFTGLFFLLAVGIIVWRWPILPPLIPLWYARPWGSEQLAHPAWLFLLPISSLIWYVINFFIVVYQRAQYYVFTQVLFLSTLLVSFLSFVTLIKILFIVT